MERPTMSNIASLRAQVTDLTILIIPYSHSDWAWTYTRAWHEERYTLVFNEVLDILRDHPEYRWFFDTENEQLAPFRRRCPERMEELKQRVREGKIGVSGGTVTNPHPHRIGGETFIRNLVLGRRYFQRAFPGADLSVLTLNDIIVGYTQLPQLIRKAGYRAYRFWRPEEAMDAKGLPRTFHWEGLDGTTLLCSRGSYGGLHSTRWVRDTWEETFEQVIQTEILPRSRLDPSHVIGVFQGSDDARPLRTGNEQPLPLFELVQEWNRRGMGAMRFATPAEYVRELEKEADHLPTLSGPLDTVGWSYWYGQIGNESLREGRVKDDIALVQAEILSRIGAAMEMAVPSADIEALWWDLLRTCPHATLWLFEEDYEELLRVSKRVGFEARAISQTILEDMADRISLKSEGKPILVFNPLSWARQDVASVHLTFPMRGKRSLEVRTPDGHLLPHQMVAEPYENGTLKEADLWFPTDVPAVGYRTFYVTDHEFPPTSTPFHGDPSRLENEALRLSFEEGHLISIFDKGTKTEHIARGKGGANTLRFYVIEDTGPYHYGPVKDIVEPVVEHVEIVADGPIFSTLRTSGHLGDHGVVQDVTLHHTLQRIDLRTEIQCAGGDGFFRVHFPLSYPGRLSAHIPFGVEDRDVTREPYGSLERRRENVFYASEWVDYSDGQKGLTLIGALGVQGFHFDPDHRILSHTLLKAIRHPQQDWERFETRRREAKGKHVFHYALIPHRGDWRDGDIARMGTAFHRPLRTVPRVRWSRDGDLP
ncbi:MAG TPA: hypothetical protein EYP17_09790, partial [Candidatus Latescibacteria bacterium]|nr:hypothetical protein [Candidatus Latescibacterota bacterium]